MWQHWLLGVLGLWILVSPFIGIGYADSAMTTNLVIVGIVTAILGFWGGGLKSYHEYHDREHRHLHA